MVRKRLREVPVQSVNTPRGTLLVSTPAATALDLVGYQHQAGGLDNVATVLSELAERIEPETPRLPPPPQLPGRGGSVTSSNTSAPVRRRRR